jgi:hypothetical protein
MEAAQQVRNSAFFQIVPEAMRFDLAANDRYLDKTVHRIVPHSVSQEPVIEPDRFTCEPPVVPTAMIVHQGEQPLQPAQNLTPITSDAGLMDAPPERIDGAL